MSSCRSTLTAPGPPVRRSVSAFTEPSSAPGVSSRENSSTVEDCSTAILECGIGGAGHGVPVAATTSTRRPPKRPLHPTTRPRRDEQLSARRHRRNQLVQTVHGTLLIRARLRARGCCSPGVLMRRRGSARVQHAPMARNTADCQYYGASLLVCSVKPFWPFQCRPFTLGPTS